MTMPIKLLFMAMLAFMNMQFMKAQSFDFTLDDWTLANEDVLSLKENPLLVRDITKEVTYGHLETERTRDSIDIVVIHSNCKHSINYRY